MADLNGNGERRKINWGVAISLIGWGGFGLIAWGSISQQVGAHDKRLDKIEASYVAEKDLKAISEPVERRLSRIETQLDQLLQRQMRSSPQP